MFCHNFVIKLAPEFPSHENFVFHWKCVTNYFIESTGNSVLIIESFESYVFYNMDVTPAYKINHADTLEESLVKPLSGNVLYYFTMSNAIWTTLLIKWRVLPLNGLMHKTLDLGTLQPNGLTH